MPIVKPVTLSSEDLIDQAVNKTFQKLTMLMEKNGMMRATLQQAVTNEKPQGEEISPIREVNQINEGSQSEGSSSDITTIYENAIQPEGDSIDSNIDKSRLDSSSEGLNRENSSDDQIDTSDELINLSNQIDYNLNLIAERQGKRKSRENGEDRKLEHHDRRDDRRPTNQYRDNRRDRFYDEPPCASGSHEEEDYRGQPRQDDRQSARDRGNQITRRADGKRTG